MTAEDVLSGGCGLDSSTPGPVALLVDAGLEILGAVHLDGACAHRAALDNEHRPAELNDVAHLHLDLFPGIQGPAPHRGAVGAPQVLHQKPRADVEPHVPTGNGWVGNAQLDVLAPSRGEGAGLGQWEGERLLVPKRQDAQLPRRPPVVLEGFGL